MYIPKDFNISDEQVALNFIETHSFGIIITNRDSLLTANHIPFLLNKQSKRLYGHFAKANPQWKELETSKELLIIFSGPHAYISPNWYENTHIPPTWNFSAVHVNGKARLVDDSKTFWIVNQLTKTHEAQFSTPWEMQNMSERKLRSMLNAIVGFEIEMTTIQAKFKLSQDRQKSDIIGAIAGLKSQTNAQSKLTSLAMNNEIKG